MKPPLSAAIVLLLTATLQAQTLTATINADKKSPPINPYLYGQFIEHLGGIITNTFWAEMLDDRKFYNQITSHVPTPATTPTNRNRGLLRRWTPIGPDSAVTLDPVNPFVGDHSPLITLDSSTPHGIRQTGLSVRKGQSYTGHIWLAGDGAATITATLAWGDNPADRQTIPLGTASKDYASFPLNFTAQSDSDTARFEIAATGNGSFHIGAVSLMPTNTINGFRPEVIAALKELHSGVYRFPGGNYISNYEWRDTIGDRDHRPPTFDYAWNAIQPNDVGVDEFMQLFQLLDVAPYFTLNTGFGDAHSAAELVEYCNGAPTTPMGQIRAKNGHPIPYGIKLWGVGNEMYGEWQLGVMPLEQYEKKHTIFAKAMRRADPTITLIASGAMPDEMTVTLQGKRIDGHAVTTYLSPADWTGGLLSKCLPDIDMISEHAYCTAGQGFNIATGKYEDVDETLAEWARRPANRVRAKYEHYQHYLTLIPGLKAKPVPISLDEYSYRRSQSFQGTPYKPALAYADQFDEMFRHTDVFQMAAFTFATSCLTTNRTDAILNPVGLVFKLYATHFGTIPLEVTGSSPQPSPRYPIGGDQPETNAGSPTYPLDVCSALTSDGKSLTIAIVNPTETQQSLTLSLPGLQLAANGRLWRLAPHDLNATNTLGQLPQVQIEQSPAASPPGVLTLAPISVNIYEFPIK